MEYIEIKEYFTDIETTENYSGYMYSVADAITIAILGSICGLKNVSQIHQWASSEKICKFLKEEFAINAVPSYFGSTPKVVEIIKKVWYNIREGVGENDRRF